MLVPVGEFSTFARAAGYMAPCTQMHEWRGAKYGELLPMARHLFGKAEARPAVAATTPTNGRLPSCVQECFPADFSKVLRPGGSYPSREVANMSAACRHSCACFIRAGLGMPVQLAREHARGPEAQLFRSGRSSMAMPHE